MSEDKSQQRRQWEFKLQSLAVVLFLVTLAAVIFAGINFQQRARYVRPYDGIDWELDREKGVFARIVWQDTPGDFAGIRPGDTLLRINGQSVEKETDVTKQLFRAQPGTQLTYELRRYGKTVTTTVVAIPQSDPFSLRGFLEFVGVLYLGIGLFVLLKRWEAPHALHFYLFCLISFIVYSFSYSGKLNNFDWIIYWADLVALVLQPALFLHFALAFPKPQPWFRPRRWAFALLYLPAALLLGFRVLAIGAGLVPPSLEVVEWQERIELAHLVFLFLLAAAVFEYTYRTTREPILTQQMKWVTRGTWLAILPYTTFYAVPFALDYAPTDWMKLSTLSLVFIPLTFGYAIIRYRLMDVDVIFRRGVAYTLATAAIAGIYFGLAVALAQLFNTNVGFGTGGVVVAIIIAAILFQPIKDWTQVQLDRLFYRERFDYRRTLEEFARELSGEINLVRLLARLLDRLSRTLPVDRMAIFLEEEEAPGYFRLARGEGLPPADLRLNLASLGDPESGQPDYVFLEAGQGLRGLPAEDRRVLDQLRLHYFVPCRVQNRTIGFLALGKTSEGSFLTSEDIELLQTLANYIAIALENARLYQRLEQKADQIARLKDFSESILESSSVGLVALDPEDRIESWNSTMERFYGRPRGQVLGQPLEEVFPPELTAELQARRQEVRVSSLYKFHLSRPAGQRVVSNISIAPLLSKEGKPIGRLLVFDDITDRVQMESQLLQREKLTSLGLLAAGVAHEVNTPLAVISNYAQMLAKQLEAGDARAVLVEKIVKQTFRASEIISGLLNFSRTGPAEFSSVDVNRALRDTLSLVEPQLRSAKITVETDLADDLPPIQGDFGKLQQVFLNLLFNARDAMPQGGRLALRSQRINSRLHVEISDSGVGIPREHLNKIYDPFFTTKATGQGTGLGLAVTYGIIQEHNGTIQVRSGSDHGTTFVLEFPALEAVPAGQGKRHV